ncbi:vesicle-associated protein 1-3-like [Chenopodium quinoa]|uniref:MSP domain-containing protein n=1 Tax=Chenopodium quinoa TaxID=63459 RepID=A0A803LI72_CHEQI|nr:vesicle-associated protein 1-3-like [Chenopodium quinoa]
MNTGDLLNIEPTELRFNFEVRKQANCSMTLTNKTDKYVAFKVKTTNPKKYCVRPNTGVVLPGGTCEVTVTMQAQKEAPLDMQCKDKFLVQSAMAPDGSTAKDITSEMFNKDDGKVVEEFKLRVIYIPANPPSPVPEESEEGSPPREDVNEQAALASAVTRSFEGTKEKDSEARSLISKLTNEKASAIQQNQKLRHELDMMKREIGRRRSGGVPVYVVVLIGILSILLGYLMKRT